MNWKFWKRDNRKWKLLRVIQGVWTPLPSRENEQYNPEWLNFFSPIISYCTYSIYFCEETKEIKLEMDGYNPKNHKMYLKALGIVNEAQKILDRKNVKENETQENSHSDV